MENIGIYATRDIDINGVIRDTIKKVNEEFHKAKASMRCNRKGWGSDVFKYMTIEPLYTETE